MEYKTITAKEAKEMIDHEQVTIVDVREADEYAVSHISGSILLPLGTISQTAMTYLKDPNEKILVYCRSGKRSAVACEQLEKIGYQNVYNFGGILDWPYNTNQ
ncbi:rhodanese-like domain-containing protein [Beduini massiliensis]|uniref:rhodanese-like domain-containing protein n=1 Tax=Beduini massiliensis TaxID=1585974 RepID=UPI00059AA822|nr:rhodanese-like domain-containing protein [Beduini massiliensis]